MPTWNQILKCLLEIFLNKQLFPLNYVAVTKVSEPVGHSSMCVEGKWSTQNRLCSFSSPEEGHTFFSSSSLNSALEAAHWLPHAQLSPVSTRWLVWHRPGLWRCSTAGAHVTEKAILSWVSWAGVSSCKILCYSLFLVSHCKQKKWEKTFCRNQ